MEFKFQRRSCKLSFLFLPRRQSAPESLLAGFMKSSGLLLSNLWVTTHCTKDTLLLKPRDNTLSLKTSIEKKGGIRSYDTIKVAALILRQKSKPVFSWYVDVNDQWFLVRNSDFFIKAKYCHLLFQQKALKKENQDILSKFCLADLYCKKRKKKQTYKQKCSLQRRVPFISTNH